MKHVPHLRSVSQTCLLFLILSTAALGQPSSTPAPSPVTPTSGQEAVLLEYARFLREEEKSHREYLERLYTVTTIVLSVLVAGGIGLIAFFQFKTKKDVRDAVDAQFRLTVEKELQQGVEQFKKQLGASMEQIKREVDERVKQVVASARQEFDEKLIVAARDKVEPKEATPTQTSALQPELSEEEQEILDLMNKSKFSFRSLGGMAADGAKHGMTPTTVKRTIDSLRQKGLVGRTLGKEGGDRWFITEDGRNYLMSKQD